ncbi:MAG: AAA family ATPase [Candidatus Limnocylindrales bacterium]
MIEQALCPTIVGRDREADALEDALLDALRGDGRLVLLAGEAGLGKTRLARQLEERAERLGAVVLWGGCSEAEFALPYLPFVEALGNRVSAVGPAAVVEHLGPAAGDLAPMLPQFGAASAGVATSDDPMGRLRLFESVFQLLRAEAADGGLLLVVEDIHWADASTRELLDFLARRLRSTRGMILATYRRDELHRRHPLAPILHGWRRTAAATFVELEPFGADSVSAMVRAIFASDEISPEFRDLLLERSEGNPFVLEELLKDAIDRGDIYRTAAGWERRQIDELRLPASVRESILQRIQRLPEQAVEVLQASAVLGTAVRPDLLPGVCGCDASAIDAALVTLVGEQLLDVDAEGSRYRFRHALTREAVYDDIVLPRRQALHSRAADALADLPDSPTGDRARHLFAAGRFAEAVPVGLQAAVEAEDRQGFFEATDLLLRALPYVDDELERARLLVRIGRVTWRAGDPPAAERYIAEAIPIAHRTGDIATAAAGHLLLGRVLWEQSRQDVARTEYERARDLLEPLGASRALADAYVRLGSLLVFDFEYERSIELLAKAMAVALASGDETPRLWALGYQALAHVAMGDLDRGYAEFRQAHDEAWARGMTYVAFNTLYNEMELRSMTFDAREALRIADRFDRDYPQFPPGLQSSLGRMLAFQTLGALEDGLANAERVMAIGRESGVTTYGLWARNCAVNCLAELGRLDEARSMMADGSTLIERQDKTLYTIGALRVALAAGDREAALERGTDALEAIDWPRPMPCDAMELLDAATEALLLAADLVGARRAAAAMDERRLDAGGAYALLARSRVRIADGEGAGAVDDLERVAAFAEGVGYVFVEAQARLLLSAALEQSEDAAKDRAVTEARAVFEHMSAIGAVTTASAARRRLAELGVEMAPAAIEPGSSGLRSATGSTPGGQSSTASTSPEERLVTVLFVDIRGYTAFAADAVPESLADRVTAFHRWARAEIEAEGGLVDKYTGDAVMATFNVVAPRLDHALAALRAALGIRDKAAASGFAVGAGLAVGPVVVGALVPGGNVSAIGTPTNLASRLQARADGGEILLSGEAYRRVATWLAERDMAATRRDVDLKGFEGPVEAWSLRHG